MTGSTGAAQ
jgi:Ca2+-binding EF-hand superfamily protein